MNNNTARADRGAAAGLTNRERCRIYGESLKTPVLAHYGTECACCGSIERLGIDHIDGNGDEHRRELFGRSDHGGQHFYRWLIEQGFPAGYQTLCSPCNSSKGRGTRCRIEHPGRPILPELPRFRQMPDWLDDAACADLVTSERDPWHPGPGDNAVLSYAEARGVCQTCPVQPECLREGLSLLNTAGVWGMWGGLAPAELQELANRGRISRPVRSAEVWAVLNAEEAPDGTVTVTWEGLAGRTVPPCICGRRFATQGGLERHQARWGHTQGHQRRLAAQGGRLWPATCLSANASGITYARGSPQSGHSTAG